MKHDIEASSELEYVGPMAEAIQACVHCGFCLPSCPTYQELGQEADSPRGRILLMKETLEGNLSWQQAQPHIDRCLGCVACETACPSGVKYGELISPFRGELRKHVSSAPVDRLKRWLLFRTLPYPNRMRRALRLGRMTRWTNRFLPKALRPMTELIPASIPRRSSLNETYPADGTRRARVALLAGCAQQVLRPQINDATIRNLTRNGVEVLIPKEQGCCGALAWHVGETGKARRFAEQNLKAFPTDIDAIITTAAGCGSGLKDYQTILGGGALAEEAARFSERAVDVSVFLSDLGLLQAPAVEHATTIAIQDACHLLHAQRVRQQPRALLSQIENLEFTALADEGTCCGSAGTYNIDQPEIANRLGQKKAAAILQTGCRVVVSGNIGCMMQLEKHLADSPVTVLHIMELLDRLYRRAPLESTKAEH